MADKDRKEDPSGIVLALGEESEKRRYPRYQRELEVAFLWEDREIMATTVDVSKTGALFESSIVPPIGDELLLVLKDPLDPELILSLKATVTRWSSSPIGARQFAVHFGDAVSKDPRSLGRFPRKC